MTPNTQFSPKTSVYQPRIVQNKKLIYIRIPLIISSLLIYNQSFWLLFYLAKFPKFRIFSNFSIRTRISAPRYSPIDFIFTCACSPVYSDYKMKKIFSKFFTIEFHMVGHVYTIFDMSQLFRARSENFLHIIFGNLIHLAIWIYITCIKETRRNSKFFSSKSEFYWNFQLFEISYLGQT